MKKSGVWYLLLRFGAPSNFAGFSLADHIQVVRDECRTIGVADAYVRKIAATDRYYFSFLDHNRDDPKASRLAECFVYGMSLFAGPMIDDRGDSLVMWVSDSFVGGEHPISYRDLVEFEKAKPFDDRSLDFPAQTIGEVSSTTPEIHEAAWRVAGITFQDDRLFDATRFLKRSHESFYVYPGQIREVSSDSDATARTGTEQSHFEDALLNAFKAIEAVIGDPSRDDQKFFSTLRAIDIDPSELAGYGEKRPIAEVIRHMDEVRGKIAHGSTPTSERRVIVAQLLDFQSCAGEIVSAGLRKARGGELLLPPHWAQDV